MSNNTTVIGLATSWIGSYLAAVMSASFFSVIPLILSSAASLIVIYKNFLDIRNASRNEKKQKQSYGNNKNRPEPGR